MFQTTTATAIWECPTGQNQLIKKSLKTGKVLTTGKIPVKIQKEFDQWLQSQMVKPNLTKRQRRVNKRKQNLKNEPNNKKFSIKLLNSIVMLTRAKQNRIEFKTINYKTIWKPPNTRQELYLSKSTTKKQLLPEQNLKSIKNS